MLGKGQSDNNDILDFNKKKTPEEMQEEFDRDFVAEQFNKFSFEKNEHTTTIPVSNKDVQVIDKSMGKLNKFGSRESMISGASHLENDDEEAVEESQDRKKE